MNYGLVHHYLGGNDAALRAGLQGRRDDFVTAHGDVTSMPLLTASDPYLKALVRWHLHDSDAVEATASSRSALRWLQPSLLAWEPVTTTHPPRPRPERSP